MPKKLSLRSRRLDYSNLVSRKGGDVGEIVVIASLQPMNSSATSSKYTSEGSTTISTSAIKFENFPSECLKFFSANKKIKSNWTKVENKIKIPTGNPENVNNFNIVILCTRKVSEVNYEMWRMAIVDVFKPEVLNLCSLAEPLHCYTSLHWTFEYDIHMLSLVLIFQITFAPSLCNSFAEHWLRTRIYFKRYKFHLTVVTIFEAKFKNLIKLWISFQRHTNSFLSLSLQKSSLKKQKNESHQIRNGISIEKHSHTKNIFRNIPKQNILR